jgi:ferredoxin--NADP+ reductase
VAYVVTQSCCSDASCVVACPVNCIHPAPGEPGFAEAEMVFIDADSCVGCGACVTACPVGAIVPDTGLRADQRAFVDLAAEYYDVFPHRDRTPVALVPAQRRLRRPGPFRVAVIGAGPAGLYAADELLKHPEIGVDVFERLDVPHGLARFGVAADHVETRRVARLLDQIATQPGLRLRLGVEVGCDVSLEALETEFDAVVHATGAPTDRSLGVPGDDLDGVLGATVLAEWSNDHPARRDLALDVVRADGGRAVVVGAGNVALDAARLLAGPRVGAREVLVLGRRGVDVAAFTTPELVGLAGLADERCADPVDVLLESVPPPGDGVRARLLAELAGRRPTPGRPRIVLRFHAPVAEVLGGDRARGVRLADGSVLEADLVVGAIGQEFAPVSHDRGRVRPGVYVTGWAKRGPTGFLGTNKSCAQETVDALLDDLDAGLGSSTAARPHPSRRVRGLLTALHPR